MLVSFGMPYTKQIADTAAELSSALTDAGDQTGLAWDEGMQQKAETARWNGGTADEPVPRRGISGWAEQTGQTRWMFDRMRFNSVQFLAAAWVRTRESDYAVAARDYIEDWMDSHPQPEDDSRLNTAIRINLHAPSGWLGTLPFFLDHEAFDEEFVTRMVETARRDLEWMRQDCAHTANVRLFQANSLLWAGLRLPFLDEAESWRTQGVRMLNDAGRRMFAPDGSNVEKDPHYVGVYTSIYGNVPIWMKAFPELGLTIDVDAVARMFDYAACGTKPNGFEVGIHDSVSAWEGHRENQALVNRRRFRERLGLPDELPPASAFFPNAGQAYLRTGWGEDAEMITFDGTREASAHNHLGTNGLQLHAHGRTLLMDPGFLTYHMGHLNGTELDNIAGPYGKSTRAHNTLNLNGWNQWMISPEWTRHWSVDGADALASRYKGGYWPGPYGWWFYEGGGHGLAATHDRVVYWAHNRFTVVIDTLTRWNEEIHGDDAHQHPFVEANWQLSPGKVLLDEDARRLTTQYDDANLLMLFPVVPQGARFALHEGDKEPFRGWVGNPDRGQGYLPAPQLSVCADPMTEFCAPYISVLLPYVGKQPPEVDIEAVHDGGPDSTQPGHLHLRWADGAVDDIWWTHGMDGALMSLPEFTTDASLLHCVTTKDGRHTTIVDGIQVEQH